MNPLLAQALGSLIRWLLAFVAGYLVQHGVWTRGDADSYVAAAAFAGASLLWSLWQKYKSRIHFLTALDMPAGTSESKVVDRVNAGAGVAPMVLLAIALGGVAVLPTGCAKGPAPVLSPSQQTAKTLAAVRRIGVVLEQVQMQELALNAAGDVPADVHAKIVVAFRETSASVLVALDTLQATAKGDPRQVVQAVRDGLLQLSATFAHLNTKQAAQLAGWLDTAAALVEVSLS